MKCCQKHAHCTCPASLPANASMDPSAQDKSMGRDVQQSTKTCACQGEEETEPPRRRFGLPPWCPVALAGAAALAAEITHFAGGGENSPPVIILALAAILLGGLPTYKAGLIAIKNFQLNMNALMTVAVTGAAIIGQWPEAAMVIVLFTVSEIIEDKSLNRARGAIGKLLSLAPEQATVRQADGAWLDIDAKLVPTGSLIRVKPGERIALDGEVVNGRSSVNQAPITGESLPVEKRAGDMVFAGTINEEGSFEYRSTGTADNSTLARIIRAVESAQGARAPIQRFVDRFAAVYTPLVFMLSCLVFIIPPLLLGGAWLTWAYRALVLLVIACPCALVISTPVTIVSGLAAATRRGLLIKGGAYLERGRTLRSIALDKTGTLTTGRPVQTDVITAPNADAAQACALAASLASRSDHPVSKAIALAAQQEGVAFLEVEDFAAIPGQGVRGRIDGAEWRLGGRRMTREMGLRAPDWETRMGELESQGKSITALLDGNGIVALFAVADTLKGTSVQAVEELKLLGVSVTMLTGDNERTARAIAAQAGIDVVKSGLLPQDKQSEITKLAESGPVGMVGDGINDAPALAAADIGFAMAAAGSDSAIETADVALMDDDLRKIPAFIRLSRGARGILIQNFSFALGVKALFFILTFFGYTTMWMAVFADVGAGLIVVGNGLRLLKK